MSQINSPLISGIIVSIGLIILVHKLGILDNILHNINFIKKRRQNKLIENGLKNGTNLQPKYTYKTIARWSIKVLTVCPYCDSEQNIIEALNIHSIDNNIAYNKNIKFANYYIRCAVCVLSFKITELHP